MGAAAQFQDASKRRSLLLTDSQSKTIASFVQQPLATEGSWAAHTIKKDLSGTQLQEHKNAANIGALNTTLEASIAEMQTSLDKLSIRKASTDTAIGSDRVLLAATEQTMSESDQYMLYVREVSGHGEAVGRTTEDAPV